MIGFDLRKLTDKLVKLQAATTQLPQIAQQAQAEALGHAIIGARRNVYDTAPGAYQRTMDYLRGFQASGRATRFKASVSVWNTVEYAERLERGEGPHEMSDAQIIAQATAHPATPVYLGRSGRNYTLPGPVVIPATVYAGYRMGDLFGKAVQAALK